MHECLGSCEVVCFRLSGSLAADVLLICISVTMLISNTHNVSQEETSAGPPFFTHFLLRELEAGGHFKIKIIIETGS